MGIKRILIIVNDPALSVMIERILRNADRYTEFFHNNNLFQTIKNIAQTPFDIIILDHIVICYSIGHLVVNADRVILLTDIPGANHVVENVVSKPFHPNELIWAVQTRLKKLESQCT